MHTTKYIGDPEDYDDTDITFHHNGDYSGIVLVYIPAEFSDMTLSHDHNAVSVRVPYTALEFLVTERLRQKAAEIIEEMDPHEFLEMSLKGTMQEDFIKWLVHLDGDSDARRKVTLQDIIEYAKKVQD